MVVIGVILVLIATLLKQLQLFYEDSEQLQFEITLEKLNSSINSLVAEHIARGDLKGLARYRNTNPMLLLASSSHNYVGEFSQDNQKVDSASWYFNRTSRQLSYQIGDVARVSQQGGPVGQLVFKLNLAYQDNNRNQRYDSDIDEVTGLALQPVFAYQWHAPR